MFPAGTPNFRPRGFSARIRRRRGNFDATTALVSVPSRSDRYVTWGCSSIGRAPEWHSGGRRFDPVQLHHPRNEHLLRFDLDVPGVLWQLFFGLIQREWEAVTLALLTWLRAEAGRPCLSDHVGGGTPRSASRQPPNVKTIVDAPAATFARTGAAASAGALPR
jgi:hypothetical protein